MEDRIARFMMKFSKFEFYLMNRDIALAHLRLHEDSQKVEGINWERLAVAIEKKFPFSEFDFASSGFGVFRETAPQFLVKRDDGGLRWDSDDDPINSWEHLLRRSFAQLRNNIAHGSKGLLPAPFTYDRTEKFLEGGDRLIDFIATDVFGDAGWETPITFR